MIEELGRARISDPIKVDRGRGSGVIKTELGAVEHNGCLARPGHRADQQHQR